MSNDTKDTLIELMDMPDMGAEEEAPKLSRMLEVLDMIGDPLKPVSDINRIIAGELASVVEEMSNLPAEKSYKLGVLKEQVKALRELAKTLAENEVLSKKDILNFDGPKFQFVFQEITSNFKKAMKESGILEAQTNEVLRNFRDIMASKEFELRKATDRVESTFVNKGK